MEGRQGSGTLLVSRAMPTSDGRDWTETLVYDLAEQALPGRDAVPGMREARFFREGCVGIVPRLHDTDLVFATKEGSKVLLPGLGGDHVLLPGRPRRGRVALIVAIEGRRSTRHPRRRLGHASP